MADTMTYNELIEAFYVQQGGKPHMAADLLFYESSWDMLMPVIQKIVDLGLSDTSSDAVVKRVLEFSDISIICPLTGVYEHVVTFIKWYKEHKKQGL